MMTKYANKIKQNLTHLIKEMHHHSDDYVKHPGIDFTRTRKLSFETMMNFILAMNGNSIYTELMTYFEYDPNIASTSAFVQQRDKIKPEDFVQLFNDFTDTYDRLKLFRGFRLLAVDGSTLNIAHNPNDSLTYLKSETAQKGYNSLHLNALYDLQNKLYVDATVQMIRKSHERQALIEMVNQSRLTSPTILIADRGYEGYNTFAHLERKGWNYVIRVKDIKSKSIVSSLSLPNQDEFDQAITLKLTRKQTNEVKANPDKYKILPNNARFDFFELDHLEYDEMSFRVVRFKLTETTYETLITNLDASEFTPKDLKELYHMRWGIETSFRELKYALGLVSFHAKKIPFILQEIFAKLTMYNFCLMITLNVVLKQKKRKHDYQVNFTGAIHLCCQYFKSNCIEVEQLIEKNILPIRKDRQDKRNLKFKAYISFIYRIN